MNNVISLGIQWVWCKVFFIQFDVVGGVDCFDLCCGIGDLMIELVKWVGWMGCVIGLDFN